MAAPKPNDHKPRAQKTKPAIQTFEFITLTDNQKIDEHDRYTVRKQAMKNNTNRRIKVIQQALQSKRFRLLPRGLQDLQDKPKIKPLSAKSSSPRARMQMFEVSPVYLPDDIFAPDPIIFLPTQQTRTDEHLEDGSLFDFTFGEQLIRQQTLNQDTDTETEIQESFSALQYHASYLEHISPNLDLMAYLPDNAPYRTRLLIQHNFTERSRATSLMMSVRKSWFALSLTDIAFFNVVLSHYAGTYCLLTGQGDPMESFSFTAASIKIINERLDLPDQRTSDGTIAAVAGMVLKEIKNGNSLAVKAHLSGLEQMINLRGGLLKANFPASLQRMIAWAELNASSVFSTIPHILPYASPALDIPSYVCTVGPSGPIIPIIPSSPYPNLAITWEAIDTDIEQVFVDLRYISSILESDDPKDVEQIDNMWYSDKTYLVQRSLVYMYQHPRVEHSRLDSLSCLAASIYVDSCLRDQRFSAGAIGILVSKLKSDLESFLLSYDHEPFRHDEATERTLMWVCAFGAIAAYGRPKRRWFVEQFANICERLGVREWEEARFMLRRILWNDSWENPRGELWQDVVERTHLISVDLMEI
ncbi:hypothetical protein BKA65DRAFT_496788 [Rhexocercosporidium sp. MPI-PUGE-AT-0058]|nr:hypothetical protein BKA65DRAFT_496788 [Rhexocercosporidium sp. MPI-PUGE-AT-0058]